MGDVINFPHRPNTGVMGITPEEYAELPESTRKDIENAIEKANATIGQVPVDTLISGDDKEPA